MATTISRTAWIDDDGSGTTGSILNNAAKTALYDQIDALFTGAFSLVGPLTLTSNPATYGLIFDGTNGGGIATTHASGTLRLYTNAAQRAVILADGKVGVGTTSPQNQFVVSNAGAAGIEFGPASGSILAYNRTTAAYAPLSLTGSTFALGISGTPALSVNASSVVKFDGYTAATFVAGDKYLVIDAAGVIHRSALGPAS